MSTAKDIANKQREVPSALRPMLAELRRGLEQLYGDRLDRVVLYGSHTRGEAHEDSDVDIMIVLKGEVNAWREIQRASEVTYPIELEYEEMITSLLISVEEFEDRGSPLLINVRREGVDV